LVGSFIQSNRPHMDEEQKPNLKVCFHPWSIGFPC
jgi:hypothetical protein